MRRLRRHATVLTLYHGTNHEALQGILTTGIKAPAHLTQDLTTALYYAGDLDRDEPGIVLTVEVASEELLSTFLSTDIDTSQLDWEATGGSTPDTSLQHIVIAPKGVPAAQIIQLSFYNMLLTEEPLLTCTPIEYLSDSTNIWQQVCELDIDVTTKYLGDVST